MERIEKEIKTITQKVSGINNEEISIESRLKEDLGLDSLDIIELVLEMETAFGITIPDDDALDFKKIADVQKYVENSLSGEGYRKQVNS